MSDTPTREEAIQQAIKFGAEVQELRLANAELREAIENAPHGPRRY
jgi:hypothetical protein